MNYKKLLEYSYKEDNENHSYRSPKTKLEYLSTNIFEFITYDGDMDELFVLKALEVCEAINEKKTF